MRFVALIFNLLTHLVSFTHWIGIFFALAYGHCLSDRLPLYICARNGGIWKPEYRLHALWIPGLLFVPVGLGMFGAALEYSLSWVVLAAGSTFVSFGALAIVPITVNYICESFVSHPAEASIMANMVRLLFGLSVAFYINKWVAAVGVGWTYGMMAIFVVISFGCIVLLMWKGHTIRKWSIGGLNDSEDGKKVIESASDSEK